MNPNGSPKPSAPHNIKSKDMSLNNLLPVLLSLSKDKRANYETYTQHQRQSKSTRHQFRFNDFTDGNGAINSGIPSNVAQRPDSSQQISDSIK